MTTNNGHTCVGESKRPLLVTTHDYQGSSHVWLFLQTNNVYRPIINTVIIPCDIACRIISIR